MCSGMETRANVTIHSLYRGYRGKVLRRARQLLHNDQAAEDTTQEVFLRLLDANEQVLAHPEPLAWLYRVTTNLCLNRLRDEKRRTKLIGGAMPANDHSHARHEGDAETRAVVVDILRRVPIELQQIAFYYHADGMTCDEIAEVIGVSRRTIGNRLVAFQAVAANAVGNA
jgi:RNA polymerase sigma-70 factor (ECF subfamily)